MDDNRRRFFEALAAVAQILKAELNDFAITSYDRALKGFGYEKAIKALEQVFENSHKYRNMPSISQLKELMGETNLDDEAIARDCVARIRGAIDKLGYTAKPEKVLERIGSLGMHLVSTCGGWETFCKAFNTWDELDFRLVQLRKEAEVALKKDRAGQFHIPPSLPSDDKSNKVYAQIEKGAQNWNERDSVAVYD